jgi:hypothetical protein
VTTRGRPTTGVKVQVRIPANLLAEIDAEAVFSDTTRAETIRYALNEWMVEHVRSSPQPSRPPVD